MFLIELTINGRYENDNKHKKKVVVRYQFVYEPVFWFLPNGLNLFKAFSFYFPTWKANRIFVKIPFDSFFFSFDCDNENVLFVSRQKANNRSLKGTKIES